MGSYFDTQAGKSVLAGENTPVPTSAPATYKTDPNQVRSWYQQYLNRAPESDAVVNSWAGQDASTAEQGIKNSTEAQALAAGRTKVANPAVTPGTTTAGIAGAATAAGATGLAAPSFGGAASSWSAPPANPLWEKLSSLLYARATADPNVDPNDPSIRAATDTYNATQTRNSRSYLSNLAEQRGPNATLDAAGRHATEVAGQNTAAFRSDLVQKETTARRQQIADALNGLYGALSAQDTTRLRQEDQALQEKLFNANTAQQSWQDQFSTIFG